MMKRNVKSNTITHLVHSLLSSFFALAFAGAGLFVRLVFAVVIGNIGSTEASSARSVR